MKKLYSLLMLLTMCVAFIGCSDDNDDVTEQTLQVVSSDLNFDVNGGTGTIEFDSALPVTATSGAEWCTVAVNGNTVNVTVSVNPRMESRSTVVTLTNGADETQIPIYQEGDILDTTMTQSNITFDIEGGEVSYRLISNWDIELTGFDESWVTYTLKNGTLTIRAEQLPENMKYRSCNVKLVTGIHTMNYTITQMNRDITGTWNCYINGGATAYGTCLIEATETANRYKVTPTGSAYDAPYYITVRGTDVVVNFGQVLGPYPDNPAENIVLCAYDNTHGQLTWSTDVEYAAPISFSEDGSQTILRFADNGTWSGAIVEGYYYSITSGGTPTGSGIYALINMVWISQ